MDNTNTQDLLEFEFTQDAEHSPAVQSDNLCQSSEFIDSLDAITQDELGKKAPSKKLFTKKSAIKLISLIVALAIVSALAISMYNKGADKLYGKLVSAFAFEGTQQSSLLSPTAADKPSSESHTLYDAIGFYESGRAN